MWSLGIFYADPIAYFKNTLKVLEAATKHTVELKDLIEQNRVLYDRAVETEKKYMQEQIQKIDKEDCGFTCSVNNFFYGTVHWLLLIIKLLSLIIILTIIYKVVVCCRSHYRRVWIIYSSAT